MEREGWRCLTGLVVVVKLTNGDVWEGVFKSQAQGSCSLQLAQQSSGTAGRNVNPFVENLPIALSDVVSIIPLKTRRVQSSIRTDSEIGSSSHYAGQPRELQRWQGPDDEEGLSLDDEINLNQGRHRRKKWDQFAHHERATGQKTTFNIDDYSSKLDRNSREYREKYRAAEGVAKSILGQNNSSERTDYQNTTEEQRYSTVQRTPAVSHGHGAYVPPSQRGHPQSAWSKELKIKPQGADAVSASTTPNNSASREESKAVSTGITKPVVVAPTPNDANTTDTVVDNAATTAAPATQDNASDKKQTATPSSATETTPTETEKTKEERNKEEKKKSKLRASAPVFVPKSLAPKPAQPPQPTYSPGRGAPRSFNPHMVPVGRGMGMYNPQVHPGVQYVPRGINLHVGALLNYQPDGMPVMHPGGLVNPYANRGHPAMRGGH